MYGEEINFTMYDIHSFFDVMIKTNENTTVLDVCKVFSDKHLISLKKWRIHEIMDKTLKLKNRELFDTIKLSDISEELKKHLPKFIFYSAFNVYDYHYNYNYTSIGNPIGIKQIMLDVRNTLNSSFTVSEKERSRVFFHNPTKQTQTVEIWATDDTDCALISFMLKTACGHEIRIKNNNVLS